MPTRNIMLNFFAPSSAPLHLGHLMFFSAMVLSNASSSADSGITTEHTSAIILSARNIEPHFWHFTTGSANEERCPEARNTDWTLSGTRQSPTSCPASQVPC